MYIAGRLPDANRLRLNKKVQKKSKLMPLTNHADNPFLCVGNEVSTITKDNKTSATFPSFSGDVAMGLIDQHKDSCESSDQFKAFPHIKGARCLGDKARQSRGKGLSISLQSQGKTIFTEGLSSISKRNEPLLVVHRRDIHGANMPESVKVSRQRSKISFGVRHSEIQRDVQSKAQSILQRQIETGFNAAMTVEGLASNTTTIRKMESHSLQESPISKVIKRIELKYGMSPCISPYPDKLVTTPMSEDNYILNYNTTRRTPKHDAHRGYAHVVSLTPDFRSKGQRSPYLPASLTDEQYNQREAFRQHKYEQHMNPIQMPCDIIREERRALQMPMQETKSVNHNKIKHKHESSLREPVSKGKPKVGSSDAHEDIVLKKKTDGSFHVRGIVGTSVACHEIWIPGSVCEEETMFNPPPSAETSYVADLISNTREPSMMMIPLDEETQSTGNDKSPSLVDSLHQSGTSTPQKSDVVGFEARHTETRQSDHSGVSSNLLMVPMPDIKIESRPAADSPASNPEVRFTDTEADTARTTSTQTDPRHFEVSDVKVSVQTLELLMPNSPDIPCISINDTSSSPDPVKAAKIFQPTADLDYVKDYASRRNSQKSVHNKAIKFMSPLQVENKAKLQ